MELEGSGLIENNPLFIDLDNWNFSYEDYSPCIDAGDPIDADPDGKVYASITVSDYPELSIPMRAFGDQNSAEFWVRSQYEDLHRKLMALENSR